MVFKLYGAGIDWIHVAPVAKSCEHGTEPKGSTKGGWGDILK